MHEIRMILEMLQRWVNRRYPGSFRCDLILFPASMERGTAVLPDIADASALLLGFHRASRHRGTWKEMRQRADRGTSTGTYAHREVSGYSGRIRRNQQSIRNVRSSVRLAS
jgi:hypothetical protein